MQISTNESIFLTFSYKSHGPREILMVLKQLGFVPKRKQGQVNTNKQTKQFMNCSENICVQRIDN